MVAGISLCTLPVAVTCSLQPLVPSPDAGQTTPYVAACWGCHHPPLLSSGLLFHLSPTRQGRGRHVQAGSSAAAALSCQQSPGSPIAGCTCWVCIIAWAEECNVQTASAGSLPASGWQICARRHGLLQWQLAAGAGSRQGCMRLGCRQGQRWRYLQSRGFCWGT